MNFLISFFYGIVEGITEWLPISSTGHLIIFEDLFPFIDLNDNFLDMFRVVIQLGAILAVVFIYWNKFFPFDFSKNRKSVIQPHIMSLWFKILVSCVPAAIIGLLFDDKIDELFYNPVTVSISLATFGLFFIIIENKNDKKQFKVDSPYAISYKAALIIGIFQLIAAIFPGTSRSGATIIGALLIGISRTAATEYTFFLGIPVMFGASLLKIVKFITDQNSMSTTEWGVLAIGFIVSLIVSIIAIKFLVGYVKKHNFVVFGWYRIALAVVVIAYSLLSNKV